MIARQIVFLWAFVAFGQGDHVLYFAHVQTAQGMKDIGAAVRVIADVEEPVVDLLHRTLTIRGTDEQKSVAEWLAKELDGPVKDRISNMSEYRFAEGDVVRVFFNLTETDQDVHDLASLIQAVAGIRRIFPFFPSKAIILREPPDRAELAAWLIDKVRTPEYRAEYRLPNSDEAINVFHLRYVKANRDLQEMVFLVRALADLAPVKEYGATKVLVLRATEVQAGCAEWLRKQLDQPASSLAAKRGQASAVYPYPTNTEGDHEARVFFFSSTRTQEEMEAAARRVQRMERVSRIGIYGRAKAAVFRGALPQVARAEQMLREMDSLK